jgi:hypothetical protein
MTMSPGLRKFMLSAHLAFSVGWIGAVVAYLALVFAATNTQDAHILRAAWIAMGLMIQFAIVPLALAALLTGIIMSVGTRWGLFRHYWVLFSLALTIFAVVILLGHVSDVKTLADAAIQTDTAFIVEQQSGGNTEGSTHDDGSHLAGQLAAGLPGELFHAGIGLLILLVVQVLNVYKPRGVTPYGWRKQQEERGTAKPQAE